MGWADDMYEAGLTSEHGGMLNDHWYREDKSITRTKYSSAKNSKTRNAGKPWTQAALNTVYKMYQEGDNVEYIAEIFKRTPYAIAYQLYNIGELTFSEREAFKL